MSTIARKDAHVEMPWRNGGGATLEVARHPGSGEFDWRISFAHVAADGPFSAFPGVDRILVLVEGESMYLTAPGADDRVLHPGDSWTFPGELDVMCRVPVPTWDLNVMTRREAAAASCRVQDLAGGPVEVAPRGTETFVAHLAGQPRVDGKDVLDRFDVLRCEGDAVRVSGTGRVAVISVWPARGGTRGA